MIWGFSALKRRMPVLAPMTAAGAIGERSDLLLSGHEAKGRGLLGPRLLLHALPRAQTLHSFSRGLDGSTRSPLLLSCMFSWWLPPKPVTISTSVGDSAALGLTHGLPSIQKFWQIRCAEVP